MQKNNSSKEKTKDMLNPGKKGRCTECCAAAPSVLCCFHSSLTCLVFIFRLLMFLFCRMHQACRQKAYIDPHQKKHKPNHQSHGFFLLLCFFIVYHVPFVRWDQSLSCAANFPARARGFSAAVLHSPATSAILLSAYHDFMKFSAKRGNFYVCHGASRFPPHLPPL